VGGDTALYRLPKGGGTLTRTPGPAATAFPRNDTWVGGGGLTSPPFVRRRRMFGDVRTGNVYNNRGACQGKGAQSTGTRRVVSRLGSR